MPNGYNKELFLEEFSAYQPGSQPSPDKWTIDTGLGYPGGPRNWGTGEVESYSRDAANLVITPERTLRITPLSGKDNGWTSARIESTAAHDFGCDEGKTILIEANIKLRSGSGNSQMGIWPAFWVMGSESRGKPDTWPSIGEIDILESVNGLSQVWHTVHCGVSPGGPCKEKQGLGNEGNTGLTRDAWHTVGVRIDRSDAHGDWRRETITWRLNQVDTFSMNGSSANDESSWIALTRNRKFILLNVAVGGEMPDAVAHSTTPTKDTRGGLEAAMDVDWVGVWSS